MMAFHDAYEQHEKDAIHEKLIQADAVSEQSMTTTPCGNKADGAYHQSTAQSDLCDPGQRMCQIHDGQLACNPAFTQAIEPMKNLISYSYIPAETKFTFANGEAAKANWTLHLRYHTTPPCSTNIHILEQGTVPILLSIGQMRNLQAYTSM